MSNNIKTISSKESVNKQIQNIARERMREKLAAGEPASQSWTIQEVMNEFGQITGEGVDFYTDCTTLYVWEIVKQTIKKFTESEFLKQEQQLFLNKDFEYLQEAYPIEENGEIVVRLIKTIPDEKLLARANQYDGQSETLSAHANEIRFYVRRRNEVRKSSKRTVAAK